MSINVVMPQMGESIAEGTIIRWLKKPGEKVERDEPLFEISTDKVDAEIPSPAAGVLAQVTVKEGQTVPINTVVALIDGVGSKPAPVPAPAVEAAAPAPAPVPPSAPPPPRPAPAQPQPAAAPSAVAVVPTAHQVAERLGHVPSVDELRKVRSSPLVRKMARENGVDLAQLQGSGSAGRVTKQDMLSHLASPGSAPAPQAGPGATTLPASFHMEPPAVSEPQYPAGMSNDQIAAMFPNERIEIVPMTPMRKKISEHMVASRRTSAHVTTVFEIDMTPVLKVISAHKEGFQEKHGVKLTLTPFIVKAVCQALRQHPLLNASVVNDQIVYRKDIHMGIAVALDWGLVVPVVRHADEKNILGLCRSITDLAGRARSKQLKLDELQGGTFTITNPGVFGSLFGTPVINQPQVGILGVGAAVKRAVVVNDAIAIRSMSFFGLSFDHRLVDGAEADKFMATFKSIVEGFTAQMMIGSVTVPLEVRRLGVSAYQEAWALQSEVETARRRGEGVDTLFLLQHPAVVTLGRAARREHVLHSAEDLARRGIDLVETNRGGDVTYHGPGQLVGYPVLDLKPDRCDVGRYLRDLEQVLMEVLSRFGIVAGRKPGVTGVWVGDAKIAALGVHMSRWVTTHGFALNIAPNLDHFALIVPCGLREFSVTSMQVLLGDRTPAVEDVAGAVCEIFPRVFERTVIEGNVSP